MDGIYSFINPANAVNALPAADALEEYSQSGLDRLFGDESILFYSDDAGVIRFRHEIMKDILDNKPVAGALKIFAASYEELRSKVSVSGDSDTNKSMLLRISLAKKYTSMMSEIAEKMNEAGNLASEGMRRLRKIITGETESKEFVALSKHIGKIPDNIMNAKSITIAVNLDEYFEPMESGIISLNNYEYTGSSIFERILRMDFSDSDRRTLAPIVRSDEKDPVKLFDFNQMAMSSMNNLIVRQLKNIGADTGKILTYNLRVLSGLAEEIKFVVRGAEIINTLTEYGVPFVYPEPAKGKISTLVNYYDITTEYEKQVLGYPFQKQSNRWQSTRAEPPDPQVSKIMLMYHLGLPVSAESM